MKGRRKLTLGLITVVLAGALLLSGCVTIRSEMVVNPDLSGTRTIIMAMDQSMMDMMAEEGGDVEDPFADIEAEFSDVSGAVVEPYVTIVQRGISIGGVPSLGGSDPDGVAHSRGQLGWECRRHPGGDGDARSVTWDHRAQVACDAAAPLRAGRATTPSRGDHHGLLECGQGVGEPGGRRRVHPSAGDEQGVGEGLAGVDVGL